MKAYRRLPVGEGETMPAHRPYYPPLPSHYRDVEAQVVYFYTEPAVVQRHLPEPLAADPEGLGVAFGYKIPFCSAYGPFNEAGLMFRCSFRGQVSFFNTHLYLDNVAAICSGRERWGAPKEYAAVSFERKGNLIYSQTVKEGVPILTLTADITQKAEPAEMIAVEPNYRLKLIPRADGPGPAIKQLISYRGDPAGTLHLLMKGNGSLAFGSSANSDLAAFPVRGILGAFYSVSSFTESYGEVLYDYLNP